MLAHELLLFCQERVVLLHTPLHEEELLLSNPLICLCWRHV